MRSVLVIDAGQPRNGPAEGVHNLLGREGIKPVELLAAGRAEAEAYGAEIILDPAVSAARDGEGFAIGLDSGGMVHGRRLILATGLVDELPDIPGLAGLWGRRVLHCPYCHGYEVRGRRIAILASSPLAVHQALLFRQLSTDVTVLLHEQPGFEPEEIAQLQGLGVGLVGGIVERVDEAGEQLAVRFADGARVDTDALVVAPRMHSRAELYAQLGGALADHPLGSFIETGPMGRTAIDGVWAAGNACNLSAMVSVASGEGTMAGAAVNADLVAETARSAALAASSV